MINDLNMYKIYEAIISGKELTTQELKSYGFSSNDLTKLVNDKVLIRVKRGHYALASVDRLYLYGKTLISLKQHDKATRCFEKCYELNPEHKSTNFQLFLRHIRSKEYDLAFEKLDVLLNNENPYYKRDAYLYLCLLSSITNIPDRYKFIIGNLTYDDIKVLDTDAGFENIRLQNKIRLAAFIQNPSYALRQYNIYENSIQRNSVFNIVLKELLSQAQRVRRENIDFILKLIGNKEYDKIVDFLKKREENSFVLGEFEYEILKLARTLTSIISTCKIPEKDETITDKYRVAIEHKDYELALNLYKNSRIDSNLPESMDVIYLLLVEINAWIEKIKNGSFQNSGMPIQSYHIVTKMPITQQLLDYAKGELIKNNLDNAFRAIYSYLAIFDKNQYESLIVKLIKVSILEQDTTFSRPFAVLEHLSTDDFKANQNYYIKCMYQVLSQSRVDVADIYSHILKEDNLTLNRYLDDQFDDNKRRGHFIREMSISRIVSACEGLNIDYDKFMSDIKNSAIYFNRTAIGTLSIENPDMFMRLANLVTTQEQIEDIGFVDEVNKRIKELDEAYSSSLNPNQKEKAELLNHKVQVAESDIRFQLNYGITNFEQIVSMVFEQGISISDACFKLGLKKEKTDIVKLLFARNYYAQGDYITGDRIVKHVEQSSNKTPFILQLIDELRRDKKFYKNRVTDDTIFVKKITI